jgi:hypothetical protein
LPEAFSFLVSFFLDSFLFDFSFLVATSFEGAFAAGFLGASTVTAFSGFFSTSAFFFDSFGYLADGLASPGAGILFQSLGISGIGPPL